MRIIPALIRAIMLSLIWSFQLATAEPPTPAAVPKTPKGADIFSLGTAEDDGNCVHYKETIDGYVSESVELLNAARTAILNHKDDKSYRDLFNAWLGVEWDECDPSIPLKEGCTSLWNTINRRFSSVSRFLNENGLEDSRTEKKPWLFCGDDFATRQSWNDPVKDQDGKEMPKPSQDGKYSVNDFFRGLNNRIRQPFWVQKLGGYDFDNYGTKKLCDPSRKSRRFAATFPASQGRTYTPHTADFDAHIFLCPVAFNPEQYGMTTHLISVLGDIVQDTEYPNADREDNLEHYTTQSCTLYHELFHLTDYNGLAKDPIQGFKEMSSSSLSDELADKLQCVINPESYVMFSLAAYLYQNPPEGMKPMLFLSSGKPIEAKADS